MTNKRKGQLPDIKDIPFQAQIMLREAEQYQNGSKLLSEEIFEDTGNSSNMLSLTALEISLKALYLVEKKQKYPNNSHSFYNLFKSLNGKTQNVLLKHANEIAANEFNQTFNFINALREFQKNFTDARYGYEANWHLSSGQIFQKTRASTKPSELKEQSSPDFKFFPSEREIFYRATKITLIEKLTRTLPDPTNT
ncbi:hypothetical protein ACI3L3_03985 [Desulfobaculum sp. SPO524]|uniref:hypothetical protein n=1 Tax=Desulfobaculum sp. SPO524 TaxID=3378071 RepID=UPI0038537588